MAFFGHLATFFTFAALVLQVFTMIGNTYNQPFLRSLYFAKLVIGNKFYTFGLWNYCTGTGYNVEMCSTPSPAFDWSKTPGLSDYTGSIQNIDKVFLANFILYWIALGITLVALVITVMSHFRRGPDLIASLGTFLAFGVMLVVFVIVLVISMKGINGVKDGHSDSHGYLGASTWCTLGGFIALLFSSINYCIACIFGPGRGAVAGKV